MKVAAAGHVVAAEPGHRRLAGRGDLPVGAEGPAAPGQAGVAGQDEPAFAGPQQFAVLGGKAAQVTEGAEQAPGGAGAVGLAGVLDHPRAAVGGEGG